MSTVQERVAAGAAWLDEKDPGWWELIELDRLDLSDTRHCVLGQWAESNIQQARVLSTPSYWEAMSRFRLDHSGCLDLGFTTYGSFRDLNSAWVDEILHRELADA